MTLTPEQRYIDQRLRQVALDRVSAGTLMLFAALIIALAVSAPLGIPVAPASYVINALACAFAIALHILVRRHAVPLAAAHSVLAALMVAAPINTISSAHFTQDPRLSAPLMIAVLAMSLQLDRAWCAGTLAVTLLAWLGVQAVAPTPIDAMALTTLAGMAATSFFFHVLSRRYVVAAEASRYAAEQAATHARAELEERKRAEAEREKLRDQFVHAQRMEAVGTLSAGLAHDMNNILGGILGIAELMREDVGDPAIRTDLDDICREAARGAALTHSLLAFSRRGQYRREHVPLDAVIDDVVPLLRRTLPKSVEVNRNGKSEVTVDADRAQLAQVIVNLCLNGADAMSESGKLAIYAGSTVVDATRAEALGVAAGRYGCIEVQDSGSGMDDATRVRIFEPFFTTKPIGKGTGLGLAMVFGAVASHGGAVEVESKVGAGSTFRVLLPALPAPTAAAAATVATTPPGFRFSHKQTVLVVDDEPMVRKATARLLERFGLAALTAGDGAEAIEMLRAQSSSVSMVILDMAMPAMSGPECFTKLRAVAPVPILLASGYAPAEEARRLLKEGAAGFLGKPFSAVQLGEQITKILGEAPGRSA